MPSDAARFEIGYLLPSRDAIVGGRDDPRPLVALAERAEALGFDAVWAGDSPVARPRADALVLLAAVAARTSSVTIGTAVLLPALRGPVLLAHQLATLDALSGGRLLCGVGSGFPYPPTEAQFRAVGADFGRRLAALEETIGALRALWCGDGPNRCPSRASTSRSPTSSSGRARPRRADRRSGWRARDRWPSGASAASPTAGCPIRRGRSSTPRASSAWPRPRPGPGGPHRCQRSTPPSPWSGRARRPSTGCAAASSATNDAPLEALEGIQALFAGDADAIADWLAGYVRAGARHVVLRVADEDPEAALQILGTSVVPALRDRVGAVR